MKSERRKCKERMEERKNDEDKAALARDSFREGTPSVCRRLESDCGFQRCKFGI
jgi:hypothetical protein